MVKKRKAGGGRKPKGEFSNLSAPLTIRMPADMRARLQAAADASSKSLSQEILGRLNQTDRRRDPTTRALCFLLAEIIDVVKGNTVTDWRSDAFAFRAVRAAFDKVLTALTPPGEATPHENNPFDPDGPINRHAYMIFADTPDEMAKVVASHVLLGLQRGDGDRDHVEGTKPQIEIGYGMAKASRELLKGKTK